MGASKTKTHAALETLLQNSTAQKVHSCLLQSIKNASTQDMDALSTLLAPLASDANTLRHCVRCHQEYGENTNDDQACKIKHGMSDAEGDLHSDHSDACIITLYCCGEQHLEDEMPSEWCILASHTTNPEDVMYYDEEEDERDDRGNERVVTCEEFGCMKKRKKPATSSEAKPPAKKRK